MLGGKRSQFCDRVSSLDTSPRHPLNWRLGGPQNRSGCFGEGKTFCSCQETNLDWTVVLRIALSHFYCIIMIIFAYHKLLHGPSLSVYRHVAPNLTTGPILIRFDIGEWHEKWPSNCDNLNDVFVWKLTFVSACMNTLYTKSRPI